MRFVVYGAGAIGGVIGGRLFEHGHDVVLIARGDHFNAIVADGLTLEAASGRVTLPIPAVDHPRHLEFDNDVVVVLAVKSHHTRSALEALAPMAPPSVPILCAQNGVSNERAALRLFPNVYALSVACPCVHLEPGVVQAYSAPTTGILDIGRFPAGVDDLADSVASALNDSTFDSMALPDMMRWKWAKVLSNLGNAIEAVCGPPARQGPIGDLARAEGKACLEAAGISHASEADERARRADLLQLQDLSGAQRPGGSSWQSLARSTGNIETDYLNGEIVLLGRLHGVPTPVNALLQQQANQMARTGTPPGTLPQEQFLGLVNEQTAASEQT
jgi:2-dehydropantoate 2-reductase